MTSLTIWDFDELPPANSSQVALWQAFRPDDAPDGWYSMPEEVHEHRETLRAGYLTWLHEVGVCKVRGEPLVDRMAIRPGLSYWWMTIPADNSLESNSPAYVAVRLMALAALADRLGVTSVRIVASDRPLARLLKDWAKATGRAHVTQLGSQPRLTRESIYRAFPFLAALRTVIGHAGIPRRVMRNPDKPPPVVGQSGICLVDYLAHFSPGAVEEGRFASNYWGPLVEMLDEVDEPVRWLHLSAELASKGVVNHDSHLVERFEEHAVRQSHDLLHRHLTWAVLFRSCRDYLKVRRLGHTARPRSRILFDSRSGTSLWQAFRAAFRDQYFGKTAMLNCLWLNLFEEALEHMPKQRLGIYLFENQPWELAFIDAWRKKGHGDLLGVAHSTMRFWDTRYFKDPRDLWSVAGEQQMPWPDKVAVNGPIMRRACDEGHYPPHRIVELEALRYLHLLEKGGGTEHSDAPGILILGEYSSETQDRMLHLINLSLEQEEFAAATTYRPHPAGLPRTSRVHESVRMVQTGTIREALEGVNVVICGATSSVALEVAAMGTRVVVVGDGRGFMSGGTMSTGEPSFVTSPTQLATAVTRARGESRLAGESQPHDIMNLDEGIARWRALANDYSSRDKKRLPDS
jgi:surface carbohydrate biosynthesis protein (TIGR04326 family)